MMQIVTWLSVLVLGPGSVAIFVWFLFSLRGGVLKDRGENDK
jgi:hypothetical protein